MARGQPSRIAPSYLGLEIFALGQDFKRHPVPTVAAIGAAIAFLGLQSLELTLKDGPDAKVCQRILSALDSMTPLISGDPKFEALSFDVRLAALAGRPLSDKPLLEMDLRERKDKAWLSQPIILYREWNGIDELNGSIALLSKRPLYEIEAARTTIISRINLSSSPLLKLAAPGDPLWARQHDEELRHFFQLVRLSAAARLHRIDKGAWPLTLNALKTQLGGAIPLDPHTPGLPYRCELTDTSWRVYSRSNKRQSSLKLRRSP